MYHLTSSKNRESILRHGLDVSRMGAAPGIANSREPELNGCFLCRGSDEVEWFAGFIGGAHGTLDVWAVDVSGLAIEESADGYAYCRGAIARERLKLIKRDIRAGYRA
jgi:hypothetical protein